MNEEKKLSAREREIMDIVYARDEATAAEIREAMQDAPGAATVRKLIQIMESKGLLKHTKSGREHIYGPVTAKRSMARRAMQRVLDTFFGGSLKDAMASQITGGAAKLSADELNEIARMIDEARASRAGKGGSR